MKCYFITCIAFSKSPFDVNMLLLILFFFPVTVLFHVTFYFILSFHFNSLSPFCDLSLLTSSQMPSKLTVGHAELQSYIFLLDSLSNHNTAEVTLKQLIEVYKPP